MESSHVVGAQKLSNSGESGWTTYLASPTHCERAGVHSSSSHDTTKGNDASVEQDNDGEESDDSMASDASSGPSKPHRCRGTTRLKHTEKERNVKKHSTMKSKNKNKKKNGITMIKQEKTEEEILQHRADSAGSHI